MFLSFAVQLNFSFRKTAPKVISQLKRDFDAKSRSEAYRSRFRLPLNERLDGEIACNLWTPYNRSSAAGKLYISLNFICFISKVRYENKIFLFNRIILKVPHPVNVIIPFRDIMVVERQLDNYNPSDLNIQSALAVTLKDKVKI